MNGAQDMGGVHGFGAVAVEPDEPVFHAEWERRVFALTRAMDATGEWNLDEVRFARENREPVGSDELVAGRSLRPGRAVPRVLAASGVATFGPATSRREAPRPARFAPDNYVRASNIHPSGHTRLPHYVRDKTGTIALVHGAHVFPDSHAHGYGEDPQWLYTVCFDGRELWGPEADPTLTVSVEAFEPYLEPAS